MSDEKKEIAFLLEVIKAQQKQQKLLVAYRVGKTPAENVFKVLQKEREKGIIE